jgi:hypothetical protein
VVLGSGGLGGSRRAKGGEGRQTWSVLCFALYAPQLSDFHHPFVDIMHGGFFVGKGGGNGTRCGVAAG